MLPPIGNLATAICQPLATLGAAFARPFATPLAALDPTQRVDLLPDEWPTIAVLLLTAFAGGAWYFLHRQLRAIIPPETAPRWARFAGFILRVLVATLFFWMAWQFLSRFLHLATDWPLWIAAAVGGLASEIAISFYQSERRDMLPRLSRLLLALRLLAIGLVMWVLVEPVLSHIETTKIDKSIAVLVDDSGSMQVSDESYTISEKLDLAELFRVDGIDDRPRLGKTLATLRTLQQGLRLEAPRLAAEPDAFNRIRDLLSLDSPHHQVADQQMLRDARRDFADADNDPKNASAVVEGIVSILDQRLRELPRLAISRDESYYRALSDGKRARVDSAAIATRAEIARATLRQGDNPLLRRLAETYTLTFSRFGSTTEELDADAYTRAPITSRDKPATPEDASGPEAVFQGQTDLTTALERPLTTTAADTLGGVLVLTDGRHNADEFPDRVGRRYGIQNAPIYSVIIGTEKGIQDAALVHVDSPESVFLGDRMNLQADIKIAGLKGQQVRMRLKHEDVVIEERTIPIASDLLRTSINFSHTPDREGVHHYELEMDPVGEESYVDNNKWVTEIAVSDDRTNLLLIDGSPRWEFRYLRNLFYGRDRGVHLQHVLLNPDKVLGQVDAPPVFASANRPFGKAEATRLPKNAVEWRKFDIIVLGDIANHDLEPDTWEIIHGCVKERGALLILIAGPNHMPHAVTSKELQELLPVRIDFSRHPITTAPEPAFRMEPTAAGLDHPILRMSDDPARTRAIWRSLPPMYWRHPVRDTKPGATVLAWARQVDPIRGVDLRALPKSNAERRALAGQRPLIAFHKVGAGRVAWMGTDRTWRLRYRVGDVFHHQFWGQFMRWGTGETLRAGDEYIRLGTDQLVYSQQEDIRVQARLTDRERNPIKGETVHAELFKDDRAVSRVNLAFRPDSNGLYEGTVPGFDEPGRYRVVLNHPKAKKPIETTLTVVPSKTPVELADIAADPTGMARLASMSGGAVLRPTDAERLFDLLGDGSQTFTERTDITLWDRLPVFLLFLAFVCAEWINRRFRGYA